MTETIDVGQNGNGTQQTGLVVREGFGLVETQRQTEIASRAAAEMARAQVEARFIMAFKRPRDMDKVRVSMLKDCRRFGFAEEARYAKPVGTKKVRGWSIRFAEAAARTMGNLSIEVLSLYDDSSRRIVRVSVTDLETNTSSWNDVTLEKRVERRNGEGRVVFGKRLNSENQVVYIVEATEDEFFNKQSAILSKVRRQLILAFIPGDILAECLAAVQETLSKGITADPDAVRKKLIDAFAALGVLPDDLAEYLGHPVAQVQPSELEDLRDIYSALKEGEASWREVIEQRQLERTPTQAPAQDAPPASLSATAKLAHEIRSQRPQAPAAKPEGNGPPQQHQSDTPEASPEPAPQGTAEPPAGAAEDRLAAAKRDTSSLLDAKYVELIDLIGKDRAGAAWNGPRGVKSLRGVSKQEHLDERLRAADLLLELGRKDIEISEARRAVLKVEGGEKLMREKVPQATSNVMNMSLEEADRVLDALLAILKG